MPKKVFNDLRDIQKEMLRILGEVTTLASNPLALSQGMQDSWIPRCDIYTTCKCLVILVELAGVDKKSISVSTTDEYLKISGERLIDLEESDVCFYTMEIESGSFSRKIYFPEEKIDIDSPIVSYDNGFLKITFPLVPQDEKVIPIEF